MKAVLIQSKINETSPIAFILCPIEDGKLMVNSAVSGLSKKSMLDFAKKRNYEVVEVADRVFVGQFPFENFPQDYITM